MIGTSLAWVVALALVLAVAPLLRSVLPMSDELHLGSLVFPWWTLLQLLVYAGLLRALQRRYDSAARGRRPLVATVLGLAVLLMAPSAISLGYSLISGEIGRLGNDPVQIALLWSTPLLYYVGPALLIARSWVRDHAFTVSASVGRAFLCVGVANLLAIPWFNLLWQRYVFVATP